MSVLVKIPVTIPGISLIGLVWNAEISVMVGDILSKSPFPISFIGQNRRTLDIDMTQQVFSDFDIVSTASAELDVNRIAQSIHNSMNLRTAAASTDTDALISLGRRHFRRFRSPLSGHPRLPCVP